MGAKATEKDRKGGETPKVTTAQTIEAAAGAKKTLKKERALWQRRRGFGDPLGVVNIKKVPISRRRRPWVTRDIKCFKLMEQVGEGTYGQVFGAIDKKSGEKVALKRIRMDNEREGFPLTAIREIMLLKKLKHGNIVNLKEMITGPGPDDRSSIYMVFDYLEYDLVKLLDTKKVHFSIPQVKNLTKQMLEGLHYCHSKQILHRDIKGSNVLLDGRGTCKLADFGLARIFGESQRKLTNRVVTLWYRSPELLLGETRYGVAVDMWSMGCLIAELISGKPLFAGREEGEQLHRIWKMMGTPTEENWPGWQKLPFSNMVKRTNMKSRLRDHLMSFKGVSTSCVDLIMSMLSFDPDRRPTAEQALDHDWFQETPLPCPNSELKFNVNTNPPRQEPPKEARKYAGEGGNGNW